MSQTWEIHTIATAKRGVQIIFLILSENISRKTYAGVLIRSASVMYF